MIHLIVFAIFVTLVSSILFVSQIYAAGFLFFVMALPHFIHQVALRKKKAFAWCVIIACISIFTYQVASRKNESRIHEYATGFSYENKEKIQVTARVDDYPRYAFATNQYVLRVENSNTRISIVMPQQQALGYLERVQLSGPVKDVRLEERTWKDYYKKEFVHYTMYSPQISSIGFAEPATLFEMTKARMFDLKVLLKKHVYRKFSSQTGALLLGMLLGERDELSKTEKEAFRKSGISHILVVSGYNISILISFAFVVFKFLSFRLRMFVSILAIILFVILVGADPSVVRAALMGSVILFARLFHRPSSGVNILLVAAIAMLLYDPSNILDIGFHLSFIATYALLIMPTFKKIPELLLTTVWVFLFTSVYIAYLSEVFSYASLAANLLVLPTIPLFMAVAGASLVFLLLRIPVFFDVLILESLSRYIFGIANVAGQVSQIKMHISAIWIVAIYAFVFHAVTFATNRYTVREFIEKRYRKFVPKPRN